MFCPERDADPLRGRFKELRVEHTSARDLEAMYCFLEDHDIAADSALGELLLRLCRVQSSCEGLLGEACDTLNRTPALHALARPIRAALRRNADNDSVLMSIAVCLAERAYNVSLPHRALTRALTLCGASERACAPQAAFLASPNRADLDASSCKQPPLKRQRRAQHFVYSRNFYYPEGWFVELDELTTEERDGELFVTNTLTPMGDSISVAQDIESRYAAMPCGGIRLRAVGRDASCLYLLVQRGSVGRFRRRVMDEAFSRGKSGDELTYDFFMRAFGSEEGGEAGEESALFWSDWVGACRG